MGVGLKDRVLQLHFNIDVIPFPLLKFVEVCLCCLEVVQNVDFISINGYANLLLTADMKKPSNSKENISLIPNIQKNQRQLKTNIKTDPFHLTKKQK